MIYKASLDKLAKGVSIGVGVMFVAIIGVQISLSNESGVLLPVFMGLFFMAIIIVAYGYHPLRYEVNKECLIIHRSFTNVMIQKKDIRAVTVLTKEEMGFVIRVFGVGGLFGYFGKFSSGSLGMMVWYATRRDNFVVVQTNSGQKIVLTPDEHLKFAKDFNLG